MAACPAGVLSEGRLGLWRRELGDPWDIRLALEKWVERRWRRK
jgi:hypothetical protein